MCGALRVCRNRRYGLILRGGQQRQWQRQQRKSGLQSYPGRRVVAWAFPGPGFAVDAGFDGLLAQGVGDQGQVDAQAQVAAEGGLAVVPPAEDAAGVVVQAEGVVQAQRLQAAQGVAFGGGGEDVVRSEEHTSELQSLMRISYA